MTEYLPLWDRGNSADFADNSRSFRQILRGTGCLTSNKTFDFGADPDYE